MASDLTFRERGGLLVPSSVVREDLEREAFPGFLKWLRELREESQVCEGTLDTWQLYLILSALQLTVSHPRLPAMLTEDMRELGRNVQRTLLEAYGDRFPGLAELLEAGWHRDLDAPGNSGG